MKFLVSSVLFLLFTTFASAETLMVSSPGDGYLNLRSGPGSGNSIVAEIYHGQRAEVLGKSGKWLKVKGPSGTVGWGYGKYLVSYSSSKSQLRVNSPNDGYLNLRSGPSSKHQVIRRMSHGSRATIIGRSGSWLKVRHDSGKSGWAHSKYLSSKIAARSSASGSSTSANKSRSASEPTGGGLLGAMLRGGIKMLENAGNSSGSSSRSSSASSLRYGCEFYCEGAGFSPKSSKIRVNTPYSNSADAQDYVREKYKEYCAKNFPFHGSGVGTGASVGYPSCETYYYKD